MDPKIVEALRQLDPQNTTHWNDSGQPSLDEVSKLLGRRVQRSELNATAPDLTRDTFGVWLEGVDDALNGGGDDDDQIEQAQADSTADEEEKARYDELIAQGERELATLDKKVVAAQAARNAKSEQIDALRREKAARFPAPSPAQAMKDHIARLADHRAAREQGQALSPIDAALRGRKRSDTRPKPLPLQGNSNPLGG
jgi:hypothetical protein